MIRLLELSFLSPRRGSRGGYMECLSRAGGLEMAS